MRAKLMGFVEKQGIFEGKPFHSIKASFITPEVEQGFYGSRVLDPKVTSIKYERLPFILGRPMELSELATYCGADCEIGFDDNKKISSIRFLIDEENSKSEKK